MKVLLDIKDDKFDFVMELLANLKYVKAETITPEKAELFSEIKEAVDNLNQAKKGKLKLKSAKELLDEL
ncbi:MAG: hypothetical protein CMB80_23585 [Flammeovirgaceae bacterium]|nr:hypothetical protein [Flammeovirgaceae bacterium]MBE63415.1 hypothetical protein [Flammeovirgaceae bacterium]MBR08307.1 hypothetical protein [Rickettsiales bacterium]|tara:strand:+ start:39 stop:245 length:207 start_codon:yes stop_codon:yes gene_type:complete